jgi:hypothetical protein
VIQGTLLANVVLGGYDPTKQQFWIGVSSTQPTYTFTFIGGNTVTGCYVAGTLCIPITGTRSQ